MILSITTNRYLLLFSALFIFGCQQKRTVEKTVMDASNVESPVKSERSDLWLSQQRAFADKRESGVNFYAFGADQSWNIAIDADRSFTLTEGKSVLLGAGGPHEGMRPADLEAIVYTSTSAGAVVTLTVYPDSCTDLSNGEVYPYKVSATHRNGNNEAASFQGCGLFLTNPNLNDIFVLNSWWVAGDLRQGFGSEAPRLEFHFDSNTLYGFDGRCEIFGKFEPMGDRMRIYQLDFQDMACRTDDRTAFFDHINGKEHLVALSNGSLTLTSGNDVLNFKKVD